MPEKPQELSRESVLWVFNGNGGSLPSGVFLSVSSAEEWIERHRLSGLLTGYPADSGIYDWTIERGWWTPSQPWQEKSEFIQRFTSAYLEHYHYESGRRSE